MAFTFLKGNRSDPYKNFKFKVLMDFRYVAGISKVSSLKKSVDVVEWRAAGNNNMVTKLPGRTNYQPIVFERGVTQDMEFETWANQVNSTLLQNPIASLANAASSALSSLTKGLVPSAYRKHLILEVQNEAGQTVLRYLIKRAWVSEYQALSDLDGSGKSVLISMIKVENEGWMRIPLPPPKEK